MSQRFFWIGCALEGGLSVLAVGLNALLGQPLANDLHWEAAAAGAGVLASLPALAFFLLILSSSHGPLGRLRAFLERQLRPVFSSWSIGQLLLISVLAGLGEELLFRGVIQGSLSRWLGVLPGLVLASALFGACHPMTASYLVVTTLMGAYLGSLWIVTGNLLAPIVAHAVYDFVALVYFLRFTK